MQNGFSLVELSIVLVILGLLTGGILAGQSLIRAAELRAVSTEYSRHAAAVQTFRDKYFAIPGDMPNATSFWGSLGGNGMDTVCQDIAATGLATCNGDGTGLLTDHASGLGGAEAFRFWQHLANAGLIEGSYNGKQDPFTVTSRGVNVPTSRIGNGLWIATGHPSPINATTSFFAGDYGNFLTITTVNGTTSGSSAFTPTEAWNIDTKMDDGIPGSGKIFSNKGNGITRCTTAAGLLPPADANATYLLSRDIKDCYLRFMRAV